MPPQDLEHILAAILSADVAGYSRLMRDDEEATVRTLTDYRRTMANLIQQCSGRLVDSPGDNLLAEFASVVDAANCAVEIQRELVVRNAELSAGSLEVYEKVMKPRTYLYCFTKEGNTDKCLKDIDDPKPSQGIAHAQ